MAVLVEFQAHHHHPGGPVSHEPYEGFFKDIGFARREDGTFCDVRDTSLQSTAIHPKQKEAEHFFSPGALVQVERSLLYKGQDICFAFPETGFRIISDTPEVALKTLSEIIQQEDDGEDMDELLKSQLSVVQKAGGMTWYGYIVTINTSSSYQFAVLEEDFSSAQQKIADLVLFAIEATVLAYSSLRPPALTALYEHISPAYSNLAADVQTRHQEIAMGKFNARLQSLSEEQYALTLQELLEEPIWKWLPVFQEESERAGVTRCDEKLYGDVALYCQTHEIPLLKGEFGNSFRKMVLSRRFERAVD